MTAPPIVGIVGFVGFVVSVVAVESCKGESQEKQRVCTLAKHAVPVLLLQIP